MKRLLGYTLILVVSICAYASTGQSPAYGTQRTIDIRVKEGTTLSIDISANRKSIVFDLLGQLWLMPAGGGKARAITNAVRDIAEDLDPSFSPDGSSIVFRGERKGRTGLWLLDMNSMVPRQLTQLSDPSGEDGHAAWSPDGRVIAFVRALPDSATRRWRSDLMLLDVSSGSVRALQIDGIPNPQVNDPVWVGGGREIAFVTRNSQDGSGGRVWTVAAEGGHATPVAQDTLQALAPSFTADGGRMAYVAPDSVGRMQVWVQQLDDGKTATGSPVRVTDHIDVTSTRVRWVSDSELLYSADGRLWKGTASGAPPREIHFAAELSLNQPQTSLRQARFPEPGHQGPARGFTGLALSPDGSRIAVLALGKLWIIQVHRQASGQAGWSTQAVSDVPLEASSLAWSPDGAQVAWSAGAQEQQDIFTTNVNTGTTKLVTALPGREAYPAYSPDGRYLAFVQLRQGDGVLLVIDSHATNISDAAQIRNLGSIGVNWTSPPQWCPESDGLLVSGRASLNQSRQATFVPLSGQRKLIARFPDAPIFLNWTPQDRIVFIRHDRLWQAPFDHTGMLSDPEPIASGAALYSSSSNHGTLLFVSDGGLRLRSADGAEQKVGWPISFTPPLAESTLIRNTRIIDGTGKPVTAARDILIERGRIARIAPAGRLSSDKAHLLDAGGRFVIPGLIDLHAHLYQPELLPGFLYYGITTVRDQGSNMAPLVAYADAIAAGVLPGPRVSYGGFQFYSDWPFDEEQWRGIEPEADASHIARAIDLAEAFGAQHIKTRTFRRWDINAPTPCRWSPSQWMRKSILVSANRGATRIYMMT